MNRITVLALSFATCANASTFARAWLDGALTDPPPECSSSMTGTGAANVSFSCDYGPLIDGFQMEPTHFSGFAAASTGIGPYGLGVEVEAFSYGIGYGIGSALADANQAVSFTTPSTLRLTFRAPGTILGIASFQVDGATPAQPMFSDEFVTLAPSETHTLTLSGHAPSTSLELSHLSVYLADAVFLDGDGNPQGPAIWTGDSFVTESQAIADGSLGHFFVTTPITGVPEPGPAALVAFGLLLAISRFGRRKSARRDW